jgi:hypothetical protein
LKMCFKCVSAIRRTIQHPAALKKHPQFAKHHCPSDVVSPGFEPHFSWHNFLASAFGSTVGSAGAALLLEKVGVGAAAPKNTICAAAPESNVAVPASAGKMSSGARGDLEEELDEELLE